MTLSERREDKIDIEKDSQQIIDEFEVTYSDLLLTLSVMASLRGRQRTRREMENVISEELNSLNGNLQEIVLNGVSDSYNQGKAQIIHALYEDLSDDDAIQFDSGVVPPGWERNVPQPEYVLMDDNIFKQMATHKLTTRDPYLPKDVAENIVSNQGDSRTVRRLYDDTFNDLLLATNNTEQRIKDVVRGVSRDTVRYHSLLGSNAVTMAESLEEDLTRRAIAEDIIENGFIGITDRMGRDWDIETYSSMVARTKIEQAHRQGQVDFGSEFGVDLAVISSHMAIDACIYWEGVVVSMSGETPGYPALDAAIGTNEVFHPNCRHHISPIRTLGMLPRAEINKHERKVGTVENPENRQYERKN